jgi:hypothetical protein
MNTLQRLTLIVGIGLAVAATAQAQIAQPYLMTITPDGARRGGKVVFTIEGYNLTDAVEVIWSKPGVSSTISLNSELSRETPRPSKDPTRKMVGDRGTRNRLTIETTIAPDAEVGFYNFRIRTPLGSTNLGRIYIGALPESAEREPNDSSSDAQSLSLSTTVVGKIEKIGDADCFKFKARAGQEIVFEVIAAALNSRLDSVLTLSDESGRVLASNNDYKGGKDSLLVYKFKHDGEYVIRLSDLERKGQMEQYEYRLNIGELPFLAAAFPLGVRQATAGDVAITGFNLGADHATVNAGAAVEWNATTRLRLNTAGGATNTLKLAVGRYPEIMENETPSALNAPQQVNIPITINGRIWDGVSDGATGNKSDGATGRRGDGASAGSPGSVGPNNSTAQSSSRPVAPSPRRPVVQSSSRPVAPSPRRPVVQSSSRPVAPSPRRPVTSSPNRPIEDYYRFKARKGQRLTIEVEAQRFGSPLDSVVEILDAKGVPIPRVIARCLLETQLTLNDRDSASRGFRLLNWNGIQVNDYLLAGNELVQIDVLPKGPDEDTFLKSFLGQRVAFEDTTPEAHAVNSTAYKVSLHAPATVAGVGEKPAGNGFPSTSFPSTSFPSNGLPVVTIYYRNDDGGPMYGKDSRLNFVSPEDGEYIVRVKDVRGMQGEQFAYRLSIHEPAPDFTIFADPENPNVPRGGSIPITITAYRADGFNGDIQVKLLGLPAGFSATTGVIRPGQHSTVLLISAANDASASFPLRIQAIAESSGQPITRALNTDDRVAIVSIAPEPELLVWTEPAQVTLEPGGSAFVNIKIKREREFAGRVPFDVRNLPHGVIVTDVGLNGVMITEEEITQRFRLAAEDWVMPMEQPVFVVGRIETSAPQRSDFPAKPFMLIIRPKEMNEHRTDGSKR